MADMGKILLALFLIGFWLFLPMGLMLFDVAGFDQVDTYPEDKGNLNFWAYIEAYFKILTFNIAGVNVYIKYFIHFLQIATALFIAIMIRGN
jgi:hypothetical protein